LVMSFTLASCSEYADVDHKNLPDADSLSTGTSSLNFFILSDWGFNGSGSQKKVASAMGVFADKARPRFILTCGDNFQIDGVQSVSDPRWKLNYENVYTDSSLLIPWYPALGNHDYLGNPDAQVEYTLESKYWRMPARYYSFVKQVNSTASVRFIVLDTQDLITQFQNRDTALNLEAITQYRWLKNLLTGAHEKWIIVTGHHPVFSASAVHGDTEELKVLLKPLLQKYNVDFYICGHDHNFEHAREQGSTTEYVITGTGGWARPEGTNERTIFAMSELGFTYVSLSADSANLYFITADRKVGYSYFKTK